MIKTEENIYPSYKVRMEAEATTATNSLAAVVTDISVNGIKILSKKAIAPNSPVVVAFKLNEDVMLQGNVWWVLEFMSKNGEHFYQTGIKTDTIIHSDIRAVGIAEKSRLIQEILYQAIEREQN